MNGSGSDPNARKVYSRSSSDDSDDVNDTVYPLTVIRPVQTIYSDSTYSEYYGDHSYYRRSESPPPYWIPHHRNDGNSDNSEYSSEQNEDESLKSSENGYEGSSEACDYIRELDFDYDRACVDDSDDAKDDKKDADKKDENEVVGEVVDEGNNEREDNNDSEDYDSEDYDSEDYNDGEDNEEEQRHPFFIFLERSNMFIRNILIRTFVFPPPTPRYEE